MTFSERVLAYMRAEGMDPEEGELLLALSGGADSTALLCCLCELRDRGILHFSAFHFHHGIRKEEADRDEAFCRALCEEHGVPLTVSHGDVPSLAEAGKISMEEAARIARYEALTAHADAHRGIAAVLTAHHADDQAETVLFRLCRGSGTRGLGGIKPRRMLTEGISLWRPFLFLRRSEILAYLEKNGSAYVTDSTNFSKDPSRNRLRLETLPSLETVHPGTVRSLLAYAEQCRRDEAYFEKLVDRFFEKYGMLIPADALRGEEESISTRVLSRLCETVCGVLPEYVHVQKMLSLLRAPGEGVARLCLPGNAVFLTDGVYAAVTEKSAADRFLCPAIPQMRVTAERTEAAPGIYVFAKEDVPPGEDVTQYDEKIHKIFIRTRINSDKIKGDVFIRCRDGYTKTDGYRCGGHFHTVKDLLSEGKAPPMLRRRIPVFCDGDGPVWAPFCRVRDGMKPSGNSAGTLLTVEFDCSRTDFRKAETSGRKEAFS